jgi:rubrerythrin
MTITEVMHHTGGTSKPLGMTYVDPRRQVTNDLLDPFMAGSGLNGPFVADLMSDFLTHERCGMHLYRSVAGRTNNPVLKSRYNQFGNETDEHIRILEELIGELGGDPRYVSPSARAAEKVDAAALQATFLLGGSVDVMTQELVMLDAVVLAETRDHANWSFLAQLVAELPEGDARDALARAVGQVEPQEDQHLAWAQETRSKMMMLQAKSKIMATAGAKVEEVTAKVRDLFS